jgi:hypothetical protein
MSSRIIHTLEIHFLIHLSISHGSWIVRTIKQKLRYLGAKILRLIVLHVVLWVKSHGVQRPISNFTRAERVWGRLGRSI